MPRPRARRDLLALLLHPTPRFFWGLALLACLGLSLPLKMPFVWEPQINLIAFAISAMIGVIFGYFPARRAAALDPIEALRHE